MKKLGTVFGLIAVFTLVPQALKTSQLDAALETQSIGCIQYCQESCWAFGEPCCFAGYDVCGCC
jgi:hypothetical protein